MRPPTADRPIPDSRAIPAPEPAQDCPDIRWTEAERVAALASCEILDTGREDVFDEIVRLAADLLEAPIAVINFVTSDRQWFKAEIGLGIDTLPLDVSICRHAILQPGLLVVPDLREDARFAGNELVSASDGMRFYAGALIETPDGLPLGTVCVLDHLPRPQGITERQSRALRSLAAQVTAHLEARRAAASVRTAYETVREGEERFRNMADSAPVMIWMTDRDGVCTYINRTWLRFTGQSLTEALGFGWLEACHPDDRDQAEAVFREANGKRAPFRLEYRLRRSDGAWRWAIDSAAPRFGKDGAFLGYIGSVLDIAERREAEERFRAQSEEFLSLADNLPILCWMGYADGHIYWYNRRWYEYTGASEQSQKGWGWQSVQDPAVRDEVTERWKAAIAAREPFEMTFPLRAADGSFHPFLTRAVPIRNEAGEVVRWFGTNVDISDQKRTETELARRVSLALSERESALAQLHEARKLETLGQLTGGVAHDFNNLLTPIVGSLDIVRGKLAGDARSLRLIDGALQAAERAKALVARLLSFARRQALEPRAVDLAATVAGMRDLIARSIGPAIAVEVEARQGLPAALIDPNQLELALLNLAVNARDAMPQGGRLAIVIDLDDSEGSEADLPRGLYLRLRVIDDGVGMDRETLSRAIEPFFSTKEVGKGTGLGLSMVHGLAAQSNGAFRLASRLGEGTTATLWLPAAAEPAAAAESVPARAGFRPGAAVTVLLVDDEALVRASAAEALRQLDVTVVEAADAAEAMARVEAGLTPDLVITDQLMPGMSGTELGRRLRSLLPGLPVLVMSGYPGEQTSAGRELPVLAKPFREAELARFVAEALGRAPGGPGRGSG